MQIRGVPRHKMFDIVIGLMKALTDRDGSSSADEKFGVSFVQAEQGGPYIFRVTDSNNEVVFEDKSD